jgi:hypothetical protein
MMGELFINIFLSKAEELGHNEIRRGERERERERCWWEGRLGR